MTKSPESIKWRARFVITAIRLLGETNPAEFLKILSDGITFIIRKIAKLIKMQEKL